MAVLFMCELDAHRECREPLLQAGVLTFRHWPGVGSFAMQFIIKDKIKHLVRDIVWRGRCGALPRQVRDTQRRYGAQKTLCATAGRDTKRLLREVACSAALCAGALPAG